MENCSDPQANNSPMQDNLNFCYPNYMGSCRSLCQENGPVLLWVATGRKNITPKRCHWKRLNREKKIGLCFLTLLRYTSSSYSVHVYTIFLLQYCLDWLWINLKVNVTVNNRHFFYVKWCFNEGTFCLHKFHANF